MNLEKTNFDAFDDIFDNYKYVPRARKPLNETQEAQEVEEEFDPKHEAKKLVAAWKKTEAEAELIKQKATSKKPGQTPGTSLLSKTKIDPKSLINKGLKTQQGVEKRGQENRIDPKGQSQKGLSVVASSVSKRPQTGSKPVIEKGATANFGGNILADVAGTKKIASTKGVHDKGKVNSIPENKKPGKPQKAEVHDQDFVEHSLAYSDSLLSHDITQNSIARPSFGVRNENMKENEDYNTGHQNRAMIDKEGPDWMRMPLTELDQDSGLDLDLYGIDPADYMAAMEGYNKYKIEQAMKQRKNELEKESLGYDGKEKNEDVLTRMEKEHEEAKRQLYSFKITKLTDKIEKVLEKAQSRDKALAFAWMYGILEGEKIKCLKAELVRQLKTKSLYFCLWIAFTCESKFEKEQKRAQAKQEREEAQLKRARAFYDFILLRRCFYKGFAKYHQQVIQEKGVQKSQGRVKSAVNSFLNRLKAQTDVKPNFEQFDEQKMISKEENKTKTTYEEPSGKGGSKVEKKVDEEYGSDIEEDIGSDGETESYVTGHFGQSSKEAWPSGDLKNTYQGESSEKQMGESISQSDQHSRSGMSQRSKKEGKTLKEMTLNEKNQLFEEKAKQRREKQDLIKKKHEEIKNKKEQEKREAELKEKEEIRRRKIEEKEAFERRRKEEQEAQEARRIAMEEENAKMAKAASFYNQQLLKRYGVRVVRKIQELKKANEEIANRLWSLRLMKLGFETWGQAIILKNINRQIKMAPKMEKADHKYEKSLKQKALKSLQQAVLDSKVSDIQYDQYRKRTLQKQYFQEWCSQIPELRKEKFLYEEARNKIIYQFRYDRLSKIVFLALKENSKTELKEKIKKEHKDVMWKKVSSWLNDYKAKKGTDENEKQEEF